MDIMQKSRGHQPCIVQKLAKFYYIGDKKAKVITGDTNEYAEFEDIEDEHIDNRNEISEK